LERIHPEISIVFSPNQVPAKIKQIADSGINAIEGVAVTQVFTLQALSIFRTKFDAPKTD